MWLKLPAKSAACVNISNVSRRQVWAVILATDIWYFNISFINENNTGFTSGLKAFLSWCVRVGLHGKNQSVNHFIRQ